MKNAMKTVFSEISVLGEPALFTIAPIDHRTVPDGLYAAKLPDGMGYIVTITPLPLDEDGVAHIHSSNMYLCAGTCRTVDAFLRRYLPNQE